MNKKIPMRKCVGCQEMKDKRELVRVLHTQEKEFLIDLTGKKNGRGAYVCKKKECLEKAFANHGLERSFKMSIPKDTVEMLKKEMETLAE